MLCFSKCRKLTPSDHIYNMKRADPLHVPKSTLNIGSVCTWLFKYPKINPTKIQTAKNIPIIIPITIESDVVF